MIPARRVLVIEDDPDSVEVIRVALEPAGTVVEWIPEFEAGLATLLRSDHDVCLLDYNLGARDGIDLLERAIAGGSTVPIILLTGEGNPAIEDRALASGAADFLFKGDVTLAGLTRSLRHSIERGRTLAQLRASERRFRALFVHSLDGILIADDHGRYVDANPAACTLFGMPRELLLRKSVADITGSAPDAEVASHALLAEGVQQGELEIRTATEARFIEFRAVANVFAGHHLSVVRDITERHNAEATRVRLAAIVDAADDAIYGSTVAGAISNWSVGAQRVFGFEPNEVLGRPLAMLTRPEHTAELAKILTQLGRGEHVRHWETQGRHRDGRSLEVSVTMSPIDHAGKVTGVAIVTRDISDKKRLEAQLAISDRMVSVGTMAAGVAHEINNPLAALIANVDMLAEELDNVPADGTLIHELLDDTRRSSEQIRHIVRDLKLFSRPDDDLREPVDVRTVLDSTLRMAFNEIRHRAQLVREFGPVPMVWGNQARLGQVFLNLVLNAAHAMDEGAAASNSITVLTRTDRATGACVVEIHDTGKGIAPEHLARLFEPFFTTKPIGIGTGLGLSICERIIHELGGTIAAENGPSQGAVFRVTLPPTKLAKAPARAPPQPTAGPARVGKILVVDDEPMIAAAVSRTLKNHHDVVIVNAGSEAIERITRGERFDVILCDLMMPQMTGMDVYRALAAHAPDQAEAIVFLTGGAFTEGAQAFLDSVPNLRVDKPFSPMHLRELIKDRLAPEAPRSKG